MINGDGLDGFFDWWLKVTVVSLLISPFGVWKIIELIIGCIK